MTSTLARLRASSWIDKLGLALVGLVVLWLIVNLGKGPAEFINVMLIGLTNGAIYGVVALGYTLVYGILQLIKDKVAVLGPNDGEVKLLAPDGFTLQQTIDDAGPASAGMFMSVAGVPIAEFAGPAKEFADAFAEDYLDGAPIDPYAIYGAQSAKILLDAIENSDGSRADVIAKMFETEVTDGLLGTFGINENGDPENASGAVVGFTIYVATDKLETEAVISPKAETVTAAGAA